MINSEMGLTHPKGLTLTFHLKKNKQNICYYESKLFLSYIQPNKFTEHYIKFIIFHQTY